MNPPTTPDSASYRQTVGDILLARGYISQDQLDHAVASQQRSGKPLGQVLVETGAITRLELASALAEQWSDTATWLGPPEGPSARDSRRRPSVDESLSLEAREAGYAQQLQDAVVELARRVASFEPTLTDLKLRVESAEAAGAGKLVDRVEVLQDGVTSLARRLDELTDGIERAFGAVEQSTGEMAGELDALTGRIELAAERSSLEEIRTALEALEELAARPAGDPVLASQVDTLAERLEELRGAVAELTARPQADPGLAERLEELTARIEALAGTDLEAVRTAVEEIAGRPIADPALAARIDELAGRLDETATALDGRADSASFDELSATVAELTGRPQADPGLAERLEELTARIEALAGTDLEAVRRAVEEIAGRPVADPALTARIDELAGRLDETAAALESRPDHGVLTALQEAIDELTEKTGSFADAGALEAVRATLDEVAARPAIAPELDERLAELAARIESVTTEGDDSPLGDPELDRRVDHVVGRLDALHGRVEELAATLESTTDEAVLGELRAAVQELGARPLDQATKDDIAAVRTELESVAVGHSLIDDLSQRLERLEDAAAVTAEEAPAVDLAEALRAELESRIEAVESRTDGLARETAGAVGALASEREAIEARIDSLAAELMEARLVAATPAPPVAEPVTPRAAKTKSKADAATPTGGDTELERLRMAVERINLHLGEREHAISELMRSRSAEIKIEDLAARIAQLEKRGGSQQASKSADAAADVADANPDLRLLAQRVEEAEKAAKADREKVLTQLERMASSIDWRFRRLESRESDAA